MMTRRQLLAATGSAALLTAAPAPSNLTRMGGAITAFSVRVRAGREDHHPFDIVEHCHALGLSAVETGQPPASGEAASNLRKKLESYDMRIVFNIPLPRTGDDVEKFDASVKAAKEAGAMALHAAMTSRRYEQFDSLAAFKQNFEQCQKSVMLAEPVLRKNRIKLAIENHKGWRADEQAAWMNRVGSEWVGVCFDFGNNLSLCEPPEETFRLLAPLAIFCHIKDMGVESYQDGFLLSEVLFGDGILPLKQMVLTLRQRDPNMLFCLEMITRDPLKIPVLTDRYWSTFDDAYSPLPARDLAKILKLVRDNPPKKPLPKTAGLSLPDQIKAEDDYNRKCVEYARQYLDL